MAAHETPEQKQRETPAMHTAETLRKLEETLKDCEQTIEAQAGYIRQLEHERDLLTVGYRDAMMRCAQLEAERLATK
jgi:hypothetical protein